MTKTKTCRALAAGVSTAALLAVAGPAAAQSEVQELRNEMRQMQERINQLEGDVTETKDAVAATRKAPTVVPDKDVRLEISGRVNQAFMFASQGDQDQAFVVDNDGSGSRFGFTGEADYNDWTVGSYMEVSFESNTTDEIKFGDEEPTTSDFLSLRDIIWYVERDGIGTFSVGQSDTGTDGVAESDLSGTSMVAESDVDDIAGGLEFADDNGVGLAEQNGFDGDDDELDDFFVNLDGGRTQRIAFESDSFAGFGFMVAARQDGDTDNEDGLGFDGSINYGAEINGYEVDAAAGWRPQNNGDVFLGSASVLAPFGVNVTFAGGVEDLDDNDASEDPDFFFAKLGYRTDIFSFGDTRFSVDFFNGHNNDTFAAADGDLPRARAIGGAVVQKISPLSMEVYGVVRNYDIDDLHAGATAIEDPDSLTAFLTGARVRF